MTLPTHPPPRRATRAGGSRIGEPTCAWAPASSWKRPSLPSCGALPSPLPTTRALACDCTSFPPSPSYPHPILFSFFFLIPHSFCLFSLLSIRQTLSALIHSAGPCGNRRKKPWSFPPPPPPGKQVAGSHHMLWFRSHGFQRPFQRLGKGEGFPEKGPLRCILKRRGWGGAGRESEMEAGRWGEILLLERPRPRNRQSTAW